jgi:hypothetical protein
MTLAGPTARFLSGSLETGVKKPLPFGTPREKPAVVSGAHTLRLASALTIQIARTRSCAIPDKCLLANAGCRVIGPLSSNFLVPSLLYRVNLRGVIGEPLAIR